MANYQLYNLSYVEWLGQKTLLNVTGFYIDYGTKYTLMAIDTTNQIVYQNDLYYAPPLISSQSTNLSSFLASVKSTLLQVYTLSEVIGAGAFVNNKIVFNPINISGTHAAGATASIYMENSSGVTNPYDNTDTVTISATGGSTGATNVTLTGGSALASNKAVVTFALGTASALITANAAGTVTITLSNGPAGITASSTAYATLS